MLALLQLVTIVHHYSKLPNVHAVVTNILHVLCVTNGSFRRPTLKWVHYNVTPCSLFYVVMFCSITLYTVVGCCVAPKLNYSRHLILDIPHIDQ